MSLTPSLSWSHLHDSFFLRTEKLWQPAVPIKSLLHRTGRWEGHAATFTVPFRVNYKPQELLLQIPTVFSPFILISSASNKRAWGWQRALCLLEQDEESLCPGSGGQPEQKPLHGKTCAWRRQYFVIFSPFWLVSNIASQVNWCRQLKRKSHKQIPQTLGIVAEGQK